MWKKLTISLYAIVIIVMAMATFIGNSKGQDYADTHIYGSWWFILLWALGIASGIFYFIKRRERRLFTIALHASFVIILAGALATYLTSKRGVINLRQGQPISKYVDDKGNEHDLGFTIQLNDFEIVCHEGTNAAEDYISHITIGNEHATVSMNNIYEAGTMRLYQSSYDNDLRGSHLAINADPVGIPLTYTGYALLFLSLVWMLIDKRGTFRTLLKQEFKLSGNIINLFFFASLFFISAQQTSAQHTFNDEQSKEFSLLFINYNDRICPIETFAMDFTKKLYGKPSYRDFSATQVLAGFIFYNSEWMNEPIIKVKNSELREKLGIDGDYASFNQFFSDGDYVLGRYLKDDVNDSFHKAVFDTDDKLMLILRLHHGILLKMFPFTETGSKSSAPNSKPTTTWYSPVDSMPVTIPADQQTYIRSILPMLAEIHAGGNSTMVNETLQKMLKYQYRFGGNSLPSKTQVWAEHTYNNIPFATILFMVNLTLGFLSVLFLRKHRVYNGITVLMALSLLSLTFCIILRWIVKETIPMANGYETMIVMAWFVMFASLCTYRYLRIMTTFGLLLSGFMLLVSHIGQMDPAITPRMPVLNSPLLSIHVSIIMIAYALLALTFMLSIAYFISTKISTPHSSLLTHHSSLLLTSKFFLFPAMTLLGIGIFVGAIWANVSWGRYWGWDPKEVWALITFMVYAAPLHSSIKWLHNEQHYHFYMILAFMTVLMTYFGVNIFLVGMHSYANMQ